MIMTYIYYYVLKLVYTYILTYTMCVIYDIYKTFVHIYMMISMDPRPGLGSIEIPGPNQ